MGSRGESSREEVVVGLSVGGGEGGAKRAQENSDTWPTLVEGKVSVSSGGRGFFETGRERGEVRPFNIVGPALMGS